MKIPKARYHRYSGFWAGVLCAAFMSSMYQDLLGKEMYMQLVDRSWSNTHWWMWMLFAIATLVLHVILHHRERAITTKDDSDGN